ncbi:MAG TPA: condensation domain-containing protein, partial [Labilithrix sp.]|nr:condensation domain-containing protein [Labilithrix sp.]
MGLLDAPRLTQAQLGLWLGHQRASDPALYNAAECVLIEGELDAAAFRSAIEATLAEATALHVAFVEERGEPRRVPAPWPGLSLEKREFVVPTGASVEDALEAYARVQARRPLDIERGVLFRHELLRLGPKLF